MRAMRPGEVAVSKRKSELVSGGRDDAWGGGEVWDDRVDQARSTEVEHLGDLPRPNYRPNPKRSSVTKSNTSTPTPPTIRIELLRMLGARLTCQGA